MTQEELSSKPESPDAIQLSEYFSFLPPPGWLATASFDNLPLRLLAYGRITFQPPNVTDVFLKWQIANWLEEQPEWEIFDLMLKQKGKPSTDELNRLYSMLLRIRM